MANYNNLKTAIQQVIYENGNQEITGSVMQATLLAMVNSLGAGYQFIGIATPSMNPGTPDQNVFYLASTAGTYVNFGNIVLGENEIAILKYNGSWIKEASGLASAEKVNQLDQEINGSIIQDSILGWGTQYQKYLGATTYQWTVAANRVCRLIPLDGYNAVTIEANSNQPASFTFLKDANLEGSAPVYATGWDNRIDSVAAGTTSEQVSIPSDATLLYVYGGSRSTLAFLPSAVIGYGGRNSDGLTTQVEEIKDALTSIDPLIVKGVIYNQYISTGTYEWTSQSNRHCLLVPIASYEKIKITANSSLLARYTFLANANISGAAPTYAKGYANTLVDVPAGTTSDDILVPSNATVLYIYFGGSDLYKPSQILGYSIEHTLAKEFDGKKIILLGDSQLGQALDVSDRIKLIVGGDVYNWGFGGCRMSIRPNTEEQYATWNPFSAVGVAHALTTKDFTDMDAHKSDTDVPAYFADHVAEMKAVNLGDGENVIMTLAYGGNDYNGSVYLGEDNSSNNQTFNGAMNEVISMLMTAFPKMVFILVGIPYRVYSWSSKTPEGITSDSDTATNSRGLHRYDYNDAIGDKAKGMKVPFFDMYRRSGRNKYNVWTLCPADGTHPTSNAGKQAEAELYVKILQTF